MPDVDELMPLSFLAPAFALCSCELVYASCVGLGCELECELGGPFSSRTGGGTLT
jgi:hypothetical protein